VHILLIHQAFVTLDEPGGTRHHEIARYLASQGHQVTIIASPISYLTGKARSVKIPWSEKQINGDHITILRAYTYPSMHRSFAFRLISFFSFMVSAFQMDGFTHESGGWKLLFLEAAELRSRPK